MSTTHSTSEGCRLPYTVVGGQKSHRGLLNRPSFSIVVLNRGGKFDRDTAFQRLSAWEPAEILSIEIGTSSYDVEHLASRFTHVRFVLLDRRVSAGEQVNLGIAEALGSVVLVLWNDYEIAGLPKAVLTSEAPLCSVPVLRGERNQILPSLIAPAFYQQRLQVLPLQPPNEPVPSIVAFDYVGLYHREQYQRVGGYDRSIVSPHWQKLEFGFRAHMWGYRIMVEPHLRLSCAQTPPPEDTTPDQSYLRFYLKTLALRFTGDTGYLPLSKFFMVVLRAQTGPLRAWRLFQEAREWVHRHRFSFRQDARRVTELWDVDS